MKELSPDGALAQTITGFRPRESQKKMAKAIQEAIRNNTTLVVEAGTGTGKTYAYLVPALLSKRKVIFSTASKTLQDQLYFRDLPKVAKALAYTGKIALLKGRSSYLCLEKFEQQSLNEIQNNKELLDDWVKLRHWLTLSENGDINRCDTVKEESAVWPLVTSNHDHCLGSDCPSYQNCFVVKARKNAMNADVVVVNHHLFLADRVVKQTGFGELIPSAELLIFDEAHQLPDIASRYFGEQLSSRQFLDLAQDMVLVYRLEVRDMAQLQVSSDKLSKSMHDLRLHLGEGKTKGNLRELLRHEQVQKALMHLNDALDFCTEVLKLGVGRSTNLDSLYERSLTLKQKLHKICDIQITGYSYWYECLSARHFLLALTPLSVAEKFQEMMTESNKTWVFTSATLSVNDNVDYFTHRLGLTNANTLLLSSPFDYENSALFCVPRFLPEPQQQKDSAEELVAMLSPIIIANKGRCFFLCTSYQMMKRLTELFRKTLELPVLMQGEVNKEKLLQEFVMLGNALLVATSSFWEGIDVRGELLSCVIIDKLPFTSPDDPLLKARTEDCALKGQDAFKEIQLPEAVIMLKQGFGRLIRDFDDRGVIILCDNRIITRPYGQVFIKSLPPAQRTRSLERVEQFLKEAKHSSIEKTEVLYE